LVAARHPAGRCFLPACPLAARAVPPREQNTDRRDARSRKALSPEGSSHRRRSSDNRPSSGPRRPRQSSERAWRSARPRSSLRRGRSEPVSPQAPDPCCRWPQTSKPPLPSGHPRLRESALALKRRPLLRRSPFRWCCPAAARRTRRTYLRARRLLQRRGCPWLLSSRRQCLLWRRAWWRMCLSQPRCLSRQKCQSCLSRRRTCLLRRKRLLQQRCLSQWRSCRTSWRKPRRWGSSPRTTARRPGPVVHHPRPGLWPRMPRRKREPPRRLPSSGESPMIGLLHSEAAGCSKRRPPAPVHQRSPHDGLRSLSEVRTIVLDSAQELASAA